MIVNIRDTVCRRVICIRMTYTNNCLRSEREFDPILLIGRIYCFTAIIPSSSSSATFSRHLGREGRKGKTEQKKKGEGYCVGRLWDRLFSFWGDGSGAE